MREAAGALLKRALRARVLCSPQHLRKPHVAGGDPAAQGPAAVADVRQHELVDLYAGLYQGLRTQLELSLRNWNAPPEHSSTAPLGGIATEG